jgi:hypothetical protein
MSLDLWLTDLMLDTLEPWIKEEPRRHLSLEEKASKVMPDEVPKPDGTEWWAELLGEEENLIGYPESKAAAGRLYIKGAC